jgi:hypothetical protein
MVAVAAHAAQRYHLVRVVVTGSTRYSLKDVATHLSPTPKLNLDDLQEGAKRLGDRVFSSVQAQFKAVSGPRDGVEADFEVKDAEKALSYGA